MKSLSNFLPFYIQMSENEKRLLFVILIAFIVILLIVGAIGYLIQKIMIAQGRKIETEVYDAVVLRVVTEEKKFKSYANHKNIQIFFKQVWIPILIIIAAILVLVVRGIITGNFAYNPFNATDGFGTLFWLWDFKDPSNYSKFFGLTLLSQWPALSNEPHFIAEAWAGYAACPLFIIGGIWYIEVVQAFFARWFKIGQICRTTFKKDLSHFNVNTGFDNTTNNPPAPKPEGETNNETK